MELLTGDAWTAILNKIKCPIMFKMLTMVSKNTKQQIVRFAKLNDIIYSFSCREIASTGYLDILKWAEENNYPSNILTSKNAAANGHIHILEWDLREKTRLISESIFLGAVANGHLDVLEWAKLRGCIFGFDTCHEAALHGHLHILIWLEQKCGLEWGIDTIHMAIKGGHLHILKWCKVNNKLVISDMCSSAAKYGQLHLLIWAREHGYDWDKDVCTAAEGYNNLEVLKWARANGCEWDPRTEKAAKKKWPTVFG